MSLYEDEYNDFLCEKEATKVPTMTKKDQPTPLQPCREAFERWARLGSEPYDLTLHEKGWYQNNETLNAWYGWQAAFASSSFDNNVVALESSVDFVVSKEHDELLKKWVMIGHHYFNETALCKKNDCTSINVLCELGNISVDVDSTSNGSPILSIKQQFDACCDEIQFLATIDRDDAIRLAGLLVAWASERKIHGQ